MKRFVQKLVVVGSLMALFGCGGGGGSAVQSVPPGSKTAEVKLSTQGELPLNTAIAGIGVSVELPAGVTVKTDSTGKVAAGTVVASGVTEGKATIPDPIYEPATSSAKGKLNFVVVSTEAAGFRTGEFVKLTLDVASTATPAATDFVVPAADFKPVDLLGVPVTGLSVTHTAEIK